MPIVPIELEKYDDDAEQNLNSKFRNCIIKTGHCLWLLTCTLGGGLIGPMSNVVSAEGVWLKLVWKYGPVVIALNFLMLCKVIYGSINKNEDSDTS